MVFVERKKKDNYTELRKKDQYQKSTKKKEKRLKNLVVQVFILPVTCYVKSKCRNSWKLLIFAFLMNHFCFQSFHVRNKEMLK